MPTPVRRLLGYLSGIVVAISLPLSVLAQPSSIFSSLPYDTAFLQQKLAAHSWLYAADKDPSAIPDYLFTLLALRAVLTDSSLQAALDAKDLAAIAALAAPEDQRFIVQDQRALSAICSGVATANDAAAIMDLALRFDDAKAAKDKTLDAYYAEALASFSVSTQQGVARLRSELSVARHLTYSTFDLAGFAQDVPDAAKAILAQGCAAFAQRLAVYTPTTVVLKSL
ncbi:MAG: hypothetical protein LBF16_02940 [Pseudomonadales bacterium]|jgi:hypothetical protein|nr:hypothetical protein [Pseudomonadales bacterium]